MKEKVGRKPRRALVRAAREAAATIQDIDITNDFMFSYIMRNPSLCIELLEYLLPGRKIERVEYLSIGENDDAKRVVRRARGPETQKTFLSAADKRGVRLDVYLDDGKTVYNVEMQTTNEPGLAQRARVYQGHLDINQMERGWKFDQLKPSFVIFLCKFDPFGKGLYQYTFENTCRENPTLKLRDEAYKLFFNTGGTQGEISDGLRELLRYMNRAKDYPVEDTEYGLIRRIEKAVRMAKKDEDWRRSYMTFEMKQREAELRGIAIGKKRGVAIGERRGVAIGEERGITREKFNTVRRMLEHHAPLDLIATYTGLSPAEIKAIAEKM